MIKRLIVFFLKINLFLKSKIRIGKSTKLNFNTCLDGGNKIGCNNIISNTHIGYGTYIGNNNILYNSKIGRYCSIASNIKIITGNHPTKKFISTHPAFFSLKKQSGFTYVKEEKFNENKTADDNFQIIIGDDVWIGENVSIMSGVQIESGAIIGANSLVTKSCKPYYIYGGVPAKKIGQRFTDEQIDLLLKINWCDRGEDWIKKNIDTFYNIEEFIEVHKNE